jgi:tRNA dimethylallyltransferase
LAGGKIPIIVGPTAVGKTAVALALRAFWPLEVISADSRQVYRLLDTGTAKPTAKQRALVAHHGLDLVDPGHRYSAGRFASDAARWITEIRGRGHLPVVVGGTGLYVRALADGLFLEPKLDSRRRRALATWAATLDGLELIRFASRFDPAFGGGGRQRASRAVEIALLTGRPLSYWQRSAKVRGAIDPWYVVLTVPRQVLHHRIERRAKEMVERGLIQEVAAVLADGLAPRAPGLDAIGIREAVEYLHGQRERESVAEAVATSTRQYAKRQETWFRHQLGAEPLVLDATASPEALAKQIVDAWNGSGHG